MNAVMTFLRGGLRFASPNYYQAEYANIVRGVHADMTAGSIRPLFQGMLVVGVVGYTMEYITIGRKWEFFVFAWEYPGECVAALSNIVHLFSFHNPGWHVIDKQAVVKKALENVHH